MSHRKTLLATDWFHATLVTIEENDESDTLVWVIDTGEEAYRVIKDTYGKNDRGSDRLENMADSINQKFIERSDLIGSRAKIRIDRRTHKNYIVNFIMEYKKPEHPAEYNVQAEKSDDHFFTETKRQRRNLPI